MAGCSQACIETGAGCFRNRPRLARLSMVDHHPQVQSLLSTNGKGVLRMIWLDHHHQSSQWVEFEIELSRRSSSSEISGGDDGWMGWILFSVNYYMYLDRLLYCSPPRRFLTFFSWSLPIRIVVQFRIFYLPLPSTDLFWASSFRR